MLSGHWLDLVNTRLIQLLFVLLRITKSWMNYKKQANTTGDLSKLCKYKHL